MDEILKKHEENTIVQTNKIDPKEFFKDRKGLYVWSSFEENILTKAESSDPKEFKLNSFTLLTRASDEKIEKALGDNHMFSETDVCAILASLIEKQPNGEEGILLNTGYANLFYTSDRVVGVRWRGGGWFVGGWRRRGYAWHGVGRVFSLATDLVS